MAPTFITINTVFTAIIPRSHSPTPDKPEWKYKHGEVTPATRPIPKQALFAIAGAAASVFAFILLGYFVRRRVTLKQPATQPPEQTQVEPRTLSTASTSKRSQISHGGTITHAQRAAAQAQSQLLTATPYVLPRDMIRTLCASPSPTPSFTGSYLSDGGSAVTLVDGLGIFTPSVDDRHDAAEWSAEARPWDFKCCGFGISVNDDAVVANNANTGSQVCATDKPDSTPPCTNDILGCPNASTAALTRTKSDTDVSKLAERVQTYRISTCHSAPASWWDSYRALTPEPSSPSLKTSVASKRNAAYIGPTDMLIRQSCASGVQILWLDAGPDVGTTPNHRQASPLRSCMKGCTSPSSPSPGSEAEFLPALQIDAISEDDNVFPDRDVQKNVVKIQIRGEPNEDIIAIRVATDITFVDFTERVETRLGFPVDFFTPSHGNSSHVGETSPHGGETVPSSASLDVKGLHRAIDSEAAFANWMGQRLRDGKNTKLETWRRAGDHLLQFLM